MWYYGQLSNTFGGYCVAESKNSQTPKLEMKQIAQVEPKIEDKIRARQIEILDSDNNVVMSMGSEDGIYPEDEKAEIITIFDSEGNATLKIGRTQRGSYIHVLGYKGSVQISATSVFGGGNISIYYVDDEEEQKISLFNGIIGGDGYISISNKGENKESEICFNVDPKDGEVTITGENEEIKTTKTIFKQGS